MTLKAAEIKSLIEYLGNANGYEIIEGKVVSVNLDEYTVDVEIAEGVTIPDIALKSVVDDGKGFILVPIIDSEIIFAKIRNQPDFIVIKTSKLDKVIMYIGDVKFEINADGFTLKKENETLKSLMSDLLDAILNMSFTTNAGPTIKLINALDFQNIQKRFNNILNDT